MELDVSRRLPALVVAEIPFDVRQNGCIKELCILPHPSSQSKNTVNADIDTIVETRHFLV
jgi:hypothetical protein